MTQDKLCHNVALEIVVILQDFYGFILNNIIRYLRNYVKYFFENKRAFPFKEIHNNKTL